LRVLYCAGEFFFDLIFYNLRRLPRMGEELVTPYFAFELGGGAVTTATMAKKLGRQVGLVTVLGDSALDRYALETLRSRKIGVRHVRQTRAKMGGVTVAVSHARDRFFLTSEGANAEVANHLASRATQRAFATGAQHVHFALNPPMWRPFLALLRELRRHGVTTSWDLGWNPEALRDVHFQPAFAELSVVFFNRIEGLRYSGKRDLAAACERLAQPSQVLVVKLGSEGAVAIDANGRPVRAPGVKARAVETTGAGDAFNGGFLHYWLDGAPVSECLRAGNICGALSTRKPGGSAGAPDAAEFARWMRRRA